MLRLRKFDLKRLAIRTIKLILIVELSVLLSACGGSIGLLEGLTDSEANEVLSVLFKADIRASKLASKAGVSVQVEASSVSEAMELLRQSGLPRERRARIGEIFKKEGLISSPMEERARYLYALSQELEQTLSRIDGVVVARVHVVLPERLGPTEPSLPSSAAVFIKYQKGYGVEGIVPPVRALVASSISGLAQERVSVVLVPAVRPERADGTPTLASVLFMRVEKGSVASVWGLIAFFTLIVAALTGLSLYLVQRLRQT